MNTQHSIRPQSQRRARIHEETRFNSDLYMPLVQVEGALRTLRGGLALRPIHHQLEPRIEARIFVAFLAYALHAALLLQQLHLTVPAQPSPRLSIPAPATDPQVSGRPLGCESGLMKV